MKNQLLKASRMMAGTLAFAMFLTVGERTAFASFRVLDQAVADDSEEADSLAKLRQSLLGDTQWSALSFEQRLVFLTITAAADTLGVDLSGFALAGITVAGVNGETETEMNLIASDPSAAGVNVGGLESSLKGKFSSWPSAPMVGKPHAGFTGNFRQNVARWSMQINTNPQTGAVQMDIDPSNPNSFAAFGHWFDVLGHHITKGDTQYIKVAEALAKRGVPVAVLDAKK